MTRSDSGRARLEQHARECADCELEPPALDAIDGALAAATAPIDTRSMSARVLGEAGVLLERRAAQVYRKRVAVALAVALLPLPAIYLGGSYVLRAIHGFALYLLPDGLATYLVSGYAAVLMLLVASTYAAIPVLVDRMGPRRIAT